MDAVGPGTLLAGRYHVQQRVHQGTWSSVWQAVDETLERPVSLRVVDAGHPRGSDVVDAARRAAGVEDPRLQRVLDVGVEDGLTYVVSEWVGADSLTDLIRSGMPPCGRGPPARRRGGDGARGGPSSRAAPPDADAGQPAAGPRRPGHGHRPGRGRRAGRHRPRRRCRGEPAGCPSAGRSDLRRADRPVAAGPDPGPGATTPGRLRAAWSLRARLWSSRRPGRPVPPGPGRPALRRSGRPRAGRHGPGSLACRTGGRSASDERRVPDLPDLRPRPGDRGHLGGEPLVGPVRRQRSSTGGAARAPRPPPDHPCAPTGSGARRWAGGTSRPRRSRVSQEPSRPPRRS